MSAENTGLPVLPIGPAAVAGMPPRPAGPHGRLFRKYVLLFVGLVGAALVISGGFDFWFGYQEEKAALSGMQQAKAAAAAERIAAFFDNIERQIGWTTYAGWSVTPLDQRRLDYARLLAQVPAITEIAELDGAGREQLRVSRVALDVIGSGKDFSASPAFVGARDHKLWFSPVYFRKQSEPYITLAIARAGRDAGVTVAEVNLKLIWDVITALKIGQSGYAYVVDGNGKLIAHPDISLVLRATDYSRLPQVAAALHHTATPAVSVARNGDNVAVLSAHATIAPLGWPVFVELPLREAFGPLYSAALRSAVLLMLGLAGATLAALLLARRMTGPIRALQEGAARIGAGELDRRLDIRTGDELEALARQFNSMASELQTSYAELEKKVEERTAELTQSLEYQTATSDVLKVISRSTFDLQPVLQTVVDAAIRLCRADQAVIFRNEADEYRWAAGRGNSPEYEEIERELSFRPGPGSLIGRTAFERRTVQIADTLADPAYELKDDAKVGGVRTLLGVPLLRQGEVIGVIGLARQRVEVFTDKQIELVTTFADQAVIAIENARLITETRQARDSAEAALSELKTAQASLIQAEKMASLGQLTAGIAHEIKNPLNFVNNFAMLSAELLGELKEAAKPAVAILDADKREEIEETIEMLTGNLEKIAEHGQRADNIVKSMLEHSRGVSGERREVDLNALVNEALNLAYHGSRAQDQNFNITLERDFDPDAKPVELVPQDMTRVFLNLFGNGFYAANRRARANGGAGFRPVLKVTTRAFGDGIEIRVRDNGTGIAPEIREKLFQPFFTTKPTGEGTGLGLSISYDIVTQQHGGTITVDSEPGEYTEFTIRLPRTANAAAARART